RSSARRRRARPPGGTRRRRPRRPRRAPAHGRAARATPARRCPDAARSPPRRASARRRRPGAATTLARRARSPPSPALSRSSPLVTFLCRLSADTAHPISHEPRRAPTALLQCWFARRRPARGVPDAGVAIRQHTPQLAFRSARARWPEDVPFLSLSRATVRRRQRASASARRRKPSLRRAPRTKVTMKKYVALAALVVGCKQDPPPAGTAAPSTRGAA